MAFHFKRWFALPEDNQTWLGSKRATNEAQTVTVVGASVAPFAVDGVIPSGLALHRRADNRFEVATNAAEVDGFLFTAQVFDGTDVVAPMLDAGRILAGRAPKQTINVAEVTNPRFVIVPAVAVSAEGTDNLPGENNTPSDTNLPKGA